MATNELSARMRFLKDSAQLMLATSSPTSAYLLSQMNQLMFDNDIESSESHRRYACGSCGCIMIPGWTSSLEKDTIKGVSRRSKTKSKSGHARPRSSEDHKRTSALVYKCNLCAKDTRHRLPTYEIPAFRKGHKKLAQSVSLPTTTTSTSAAASPANTNSKKRARARKQGGLQALLAAKKENGASGGYGLDLMNFMKKA